MRSNPADGAGIAADAHSNGFKKEAFFQMAIKKSPSRNKKSSTRKNSAPVLDKLRGVEFQTSLIQAIHEASPDGILVVDSRDKIASVNQRFFDVWQIPKDCVPDRQASGVVGTSDQPILEMATERVKDPRGFVRRVKELYADPDQDDHCEIELKDGRTLERHSTVLRGKNGRYLGRVWFFRDITIHKRTEATLRDLASHDSLTGTANRRHFFERAAEEYARARRYDRPVSIVVLDIDRFKLINDRYGHARGDEVLKTMADGCKTQLREVDLFARIGGEEFAVLLPDTDLGDARMVADRLREFTGAQKVVTEGAEIHWTVSAGVATQSVADASIEDCLKRADNALYLAKEGGRNRVEADNTTA